MSAALSLSLTLPPICKYQYTSRDTHVPKSTTRELPCPKEPSEFKLSRRNLIHYTTLGLTGAGFSVSSPANAAEPESPASSTSSRMSYSRFLEYLDEGAVKKVDLFENCTVAIAEIYSPLLEKIQRVKIQLPGLPRELLTKLKEKNVDFAAHPVEVSMWPAILDLLGNLAFPLILIGALLLNSSGSDTPAGGPNLPFGLGRYVF